MPDSDNWQQIDYKYDVYGRRSEKLVDGYATRYLYDGSQVIAEYDGNNNLLRKYIYGLGIDQPVSMIEVADSNAAYYYHYDALGSVIALSDSSGDTVQTYEYSVFGEPAVEDANHTNPYMFAGRRYDIEIGLYYNRARYYNPYTGRFLQTDPIGYGDGMNLYAYCDNNPVVFVDPSGLLGTTHEGLNEGIYDNPLVYIQRRKIGNPEETELTVIQVSSMQMLYNLLFWDPCFGDEWEIYDLTIYGHGDANGHLLIGHGGDAETVKGHYLAEGVDPSGNYGGMFGTEHRNYCEMAGIDYKELTHNDLFKLRFASDAKIELTYCYSGKEEHDSTGVGFKKLLPGATVWGWGGKVRAWPINVEKGKWIVYGVDHRKILDE